MRPPRERLLLGSALLAAALTGGCSTYPRTPIIVPPEAVREWAWLPDGQPQPGRYVIRMTDGRREWEVELPEVASGTEVRVPLRTSTARDGERGGPTAADREMDAAEGARRRARHAEEPGFVEGPPPATGPGEALVRRPAAVAPERKKPRSSYLVSVAQIRELYAARNYEIALVQLVDLEREYPHDEKLLAMKGTIYRALGKNRLARDAWERVLASNPDNALVAAALRDLADEEERGRGRRTREGASDDEGAPSAGEGPPTRLDPDGEGDAPDRAPPRRGKPRTGAVDR